MHNLLPGVEGFMYPNEMELQWSILIVLYPFITGLVAGAFILASLERVFNLEAIRPTYRLALLTALAFLIVAPLPLQLHLGHPERSIEMFLTPHKTSAMAMFGFVYLWYLLAVLVIEIWLEYRPYIVARAQSAAGWSRWFYRAATLGSYNLSPRALRIDDRIGRLITVVGIPSAFLLHGYVGFIFGSVKANPWWSSVMMPVVFLFSAIVSGIAIVMLLYMIIIPIRGGKIAMKCLDRVASFLFYAVIVDFSIEVLDFIHRLYESEESIKILSELVTTKLFMSLVVLQILLGMLLPLAVMAVIKVFKLQEDLRKLLYFVCALLIQLGIFSTRWNVVIGGQLFSKSLRGLTVYKLQVLGLEGVFISAGLLLLPLVILYVLVKILPPWTDDAPQAAPSS